MEEVPGIIPELRSQCFLPPNQAPSFVREIPAGATSRGTSGLFKESCLSIMLTLGIFRYKSAGIATVRSITFNH